MNDTPKIAARSPSIVELEAGTKYSFCTCGLTETEPFCDGTHKTADTTLRSHKFTPEKSGTYRLCRCKHSQNIPFCDGTHMTLSEA
ncbi:MAG: CDGSH iron-sulfur domain-containing protein [Alphaproteobacteria bacterium]|nr:CDGSH iron-sulfur domain-containing protein [Alphaproteobacteria bacterium]